MKVLFVILNIVFQIFILEEMRNRDHLQDKFESQECILGTIVNRLR